MNLPTYPDLAGKVAFVTGGSSGIGATTCRLLAANGVRVGVNGRNEAAIDGVVKAIREKGGDALACPADCTNADALAFSELATEMTMSCASQVTWPIPYSGQPAWTSTSPAGAPDEYYTVYYTSQQQPTPAPSADGHWVECVR